MSKAEIIGNTPEIFAAPGKNNMEFVMQYIQKAWQGIPQSFDWWSITKDKHIFPKEVFLRKGNYFGKEVIIASGRDITERVKAENIIKESHNTYKDLIDNSPNGIIIQVDEIIEFTNPKAVKMLGYKKTEQLIGKNIIEILNPGQEEKYKKRKEFFNKGEPQAFMEFEIIRGDGKKSIIESIPATINYYGKPAIQIVLIDNEEKKKLDKEKLRAEVAEEANFKLQKEINERIHAEKELTDAKNFIRNIIDSSLDIICASDSNGKITEMNPAGLKMFGYNLEEIIGKNISVLFADKKNYSGVIENLFIKQGSFSGEVYNIKKNGETFISFLSASPLKNESEQIIGTMGVSRNITEIKEGERRLRESEERYRALYNQAYIGIAKVGLDGKFLEVNQQFSNITGYEHIELLQKTFIDITHPEDIDMSNNVLDKFINGKIDKISFEKRYIHKNGHTLHISVTIALVKSIKGKPDYFVSVFQDISERKEAEDALINSLKEKEILLKEIHHRVKNNLQVISSILNLQTSYVQDSKTLQILQESQNRIKSMSFIHENLYQASNFSRIDFSAYINNLSKNLLYSYQISNAHIDLILDLDKVFLDIDTAIPCGLILNELITNAIKYGFKDRNNGKLEICVKEKNKNIKIVIADDGIGLPENFNMNETNTLGLQLVNALAEQIESKLHYETSKNGTKFIISFINKN
jgi:PAS domain S-box-containing protein